MRWRSSGTDGHSRIRIALKAAYPRFTYNVGDAVVKVQVGRSKIGGKEVNLDQCCGHRAIEHVEDRTGGVIKDRCCW
jgi:hypothetical protein